MGQKVCKKCLEVKLLGEFYKNKATKDGKTIYCIVCIKSKSNKITRDELELYTEGLDYIFVPDDYFKDPSKYPDIGFNVV